MLSHESEFEVYCGDGWLTDVNLYPGFSDGIRAFWDPKHRQLLATVQCHRSIDAHVIQKTARSSSPDMGIFCDSFLRRLRPDMQLGVIADRGIPTGFRLDEIRGGSIAGVLAHEMIHTSLLGKGMSP